MDDVLRRDVDCLLPELADAVDVFTDELFLVRHDLDPLTPQHEQSAWNTHLVSLSHPVAVARQVEHGACEQLHLVTVFLVVDVLKQVQHRVLLQLLEVLSPGHLWEALADPLLQPRGLGLVHLAGGEVLDDCLATGAGGIKF